MGFMVTSLIFSVVGIIASLCTRICFNRGPSTNLLHLTLVVTATVCCWMMGIVWTEHLFLGSISIHVICMTKLNCGQLCILLR
ncbi:hypothetical protein RHGRI_009454 [Rhododendron griersonianum]|uniref:Uncharacterized protein n=1 Tax=Rhododendron griersonianum TaxID=479676 RepID=A0AAV6KFG3_9ERIC|nr:hypothetical protein RHGRI_009454 [Rhododendron griersonianum]